MTTLYTAIIRQAAYGVSTATTINYFLPGSIVNFANLTIAEHVRDNLLPEINGLQGDYVSNVDLYVRNSTTAIAPVTLSLVGGGTRTSTASVRQPAYLTAGVRWLTSETQYGPRSTPITRGFTRLSGLLDDDVVNGRISDDYVTNLVATLIPAWTATVTYSGNTFLPCIHVNRLGGSNWKIAQITGHVDIRLGTQNTRKR